VNSIEIGSNYDYYLIREDSLTLKVCFLNFGLVFPLAAVGIILGLKEWRRLFLLYVFAGQFILFSLLFYVISRYRFPVVPYLILFAAFGFGKMIEYCRRRKAGLLVLMAVALAAAYYFSNLDPGLGRLSNPYYNLAVAHTGRNEYEEAVAAYLEGLKIEPDNYRILYNLGNIYYDLEKWDQAVARYEEALRINPNLSAARQNLANALAKDRRFAEAIAEYQRLLRMNPEDPEIYYNLSLVYRQLGDNNKAEDYYQKFWELEFKNR
jgi:tetratricopeptide (TPR) repeat protein